MAARTKDAMLKIESTNIHAELVSGNSIEIDGIPALKGPYRRKLWRTGRHTHKAVRQTLSWGIKGLQSC